MKINLCVYEMQKALKFDAPLIYLQPHSIHRIARSMFVSRNKYREDACNECLQRTDDEDERERQKHSVLNPNCKVSI